MRDPKRIHEVLEKIRSYWVQHPELRLGQILEIMASDRDVDVFYLEDDALVEALVARMETER